MSNDRLKPQLAYEYRNGKKYLRTASRGNLSVDSKNSKNSPAGTKHLRSRKDVDGVYDTNIYLDLNLKDNQSGLTDQEKSKLTNSIKHFSIENRSKQKEDGFHQSLDNTHELFDQLSQEDQYFQEFKKT